MQIVRMTEKWIPSVLLLEQACFSEPWSEAGLTEAVASPLYRYFVACLGDELLGYGPKEDGAVYMYEIKKAE